MTRALAILLLATGLAHAGNKPKLKLTSVFTPLPPSKACSAAAESTLQCPGRSEYTVTINKADAGSYIRVQKGELVVDLPDGKLGPQLEWRMADGVPFAVIARVEGVDGKRYVVRGLAGYEAIGGQIDAKEKRAGKKAQQLADAGFASAKSLPDKKR